jgi:O-antigen biosynthesis protein
MRISIVIATYRGAERLERLLPTIVGDDLEVIVVDDGSPAVDAAAILGVVANSGCSVGKFPLRNETNRGYAACVRDGVAAATGEVVLLLDDDVRLPGGFFETLRGLMGATPNIGVLAWRSEGRNPGQSRRSVLGYMEPATQLASYCYAFKRSVWDELGGFDTRYRFYCIDSDFALRAMLAGHPCYRVWWPLVPHDEHGGAVDTVSFDRGHIGQQDSAIFAAKWGANGDEMERRAIAGLLARADS